MISECLTERSSSDFYASNMTTRNTNDITRTWTLISGDNAFDSFKNLPILGYYSRLSN